MTPIRGPDQGQRSGPVAANNNSNNNNSYNNKYKNMHNYPATRAAPVAPGGGPQPQYSPVPAVKATPPQMGRSQCNTLTRVSDWDYSRISFCIDYRETNSIPSSTESGAGLSLIKRLEYIAASSRPVIIQFIITIISEYRYRRLLFSTAGVQAEHSNLSPST